MRLVACTVITVSPVWRCVQHDGLAMGAPSSGLTAEIFLQHMEHTHLPLLARKHKIINYCQYVDNIFLIFDSTHTSIREILED